MAGLLGGSSSKQESSESSSEFVDVDYGGNGGVGGYLNGAGVADSIELGDSAQLGDTIRTFVDDGANLTQDQSDNSSSVVNITDGGAFAASMDFATEQSLNNLDVIEAAITATYDGYSANSDTFEGLVDSHNEIVLEGFGAASNFADLASADGDRNAAFANDLYGVGVDAVSDAYSESAKQTQYAYTNAAGMLSDAYEDASASNQRALNASLDTMAFANNSILEQNNNSLRVVERTTNNAMNRSIDAVENANQSALGAIIGMFSKSGDDAKETNSTALDYVARAQQSESERTTDTLLKWGLGGAAIVGIAWAIRGAL